MPFACHVYYGNGNRMTDNALILVLSGTPIRLRFKGWEIGVMFTDGIQLRYFLIQVMSPRPGSPVTSWQGLFLGHVVFLTLAHLHNLNQGTAFRNEIW